MADDVDSLSSPPTSLVQGPRPSFRKLPPVDKRSESSDRSDGKISTFPRLEIDVPCGLPFSVSVSDDVRGWGGGGGGSLWMVERVGC